MRIVGSRATRKLTKQETDEYAKLAAETKAFFKAGEAKQIEVGDIRNTTGLVDCFDFGSWVSSPDDGTYELTKFWKRKVDTFCLDMNKKSKSWQVEPIFVDERDETYLGITFRLK